MNAVYEVNLAGTWDFTPEGASRTLIQVPGGGWLKQGFDCEAGIYERRIRVPAVLKNQVTRLELGAVNHLAEVWIGEDDQSLRKIHAEVTAFTGQVIDLTSHVEPGRDYLLRIAVRAYQNGRPIAPHCAEWCESIARGIFREAALRIYPDVFIQDFFVRTSVAKRELEYEVWITNASQERRPVELSGCLTSWNDCPWTYPDLPDLRVNLEAGETVKVSSKPVSWKAGEASYWLPNVPYRAGYRAQLHILTLKAIAGEARHQVHIRFGFREIRQVGAHYQLNGVRVNFRGDNLQVANYDRIDFGGKGDAIDTFPGFLPPGAANPGWPEAVDRFLRLNYNVQRQHMTPWSPYMIDVCDEMGLMLIAESACRWDGFDMENGRGFHEVKCLQDIVRRDRNHPSIIRWSLKNEAQCLDPAYHVELYEAVKAIDDTRPISEDILVANRETFAPEKLFSGLLDKPDFTWVEHYLSYDQNGRPYFTSILYNDALVPLQGRPYGLGEANWMRSSTPAGLAWFATTTALARVQGASDVRPYVLLSNWAASIPGVKTTDFLTEENRRPVYGEDNLPDPWSHPGIQLIQIAYHPLLALDVEFWQLNRKCNPFGGFPVSALQVPANTKVNRSITVFNDEMAGDQLELAWELCEGSPSNWALEQGKVDLTVPCGSCQALQVSFDTPGFNTYLFLKLKVFKDGVKRFVDDGLACYEVTGGGDFNPEFYGQGKQFK